MKVRDGNLGYLVVGVVNTSVYRCLLGLSSHVSVCLLRCVSPVSSTVSIRVGSTYVRGWIRPVTGVSSF